MIFVKDSAMLRINKARSTSGDGLNELGFNSMQNKGWVRNYLKSSVNGNERQKLNLCQTREVK